LSEAGTSVRRRFSGSSQAGKAPICEPTLHRFGHNA
jgi:hypothetical protein